MAEPGRPAHAPTDKLRGMVEGYAACGTPEADIAVLIGIDPKTLRKHYRAELDTAHIKANAKVAQSLFNHATNPASGIKGVTAAIFWMKTRGRWKETDRHEIVGADGKPIQLESKAAPDLSALDQEGRDALRTVLTRLASGPEGDDPGA